MSKIVTLGIETSCDDTSMAIMVNEKLICLKSYDQAAQVQKWGGVVPEVAARQHAQKLPLLFDEVLKEAKVTTDDINLIGVTAQPGLLGALLMGMNFAKSLSLFYKIDIYPVNHLHAHLEAIHLSEQVSYPYLGVLISGGHSLFAIVQKNKELEVIASTVDDAMGEAFDKGARAIGLPYPGGALIDRLSQWGDPTRFEFPIGLIKSADARLSFSGSKTAIKVFHEKNKFQTPTKFDRKLTEHQDFYDMCASYQASLAKALKLKLRYAKQEFQQRTGVKDFSIVVGGGVACNSAVREQLKQALFVRPKFCTDNGAMIANFAWRERASSIKYPACLEIDAKGRYINKKDFIK